ncbi:MAG: hypothetical protein J5J00_16015 [Deltaproteobacteria bacterium]|nr:hypothetical protein [Deltaproteobacteria bacterium]
MRNRLIKAAVISLLAGAQACSLGSSAENDTVEPIALQALDLYVSRSSFRQASFEQFKISSRRLFAECGRMAGGRQYSQYQKVTKLSEEDAESIAQAASKVKRFADSHELKLDEEGESNSMFDPGQLRIKITAGEGTTEIQTTLDTVATPAKSSTELINRLASEIRGVALRDSQSGTLCGNKNFFDLKSKAS